ncbi:uncharacterized [Tachysurus ichikawai]
MRAISGVKTAPEALELPAQHCVNLLHNLEPHALPLPHYQVWDEGKGDHEVSLVITLGPSAPIKERSQTCGEQTADCMASFYTILMKAMREVN